MIFDASIFNGIYLTVNPVPIIYLVWIFSLRASLLLRNTSRFLPNSPSLLPRSFCFEMQIIEPNTISVIRRSIFNKATSKSPEWFLAVCKREGGERSGRKGQFSWALNRKTPSQKLEEVLKSGKTLERRAEMCDFVYTQRNIRNVHIFTIRPMSPILSFSIVKVCNTYINM